MVYDAVDITSSFHAEKSLQYPLLSDVGGVNVNKLGILNEKYAEGSNLFGIPHPGVMYIDGDGIIRAKYAIPGYRQRPPFGPLLEHIKGLLGQ